MSLLDSLDAAAGKRGLAHQIAVMDLRRYIRQTPTRLLIDEIEGIHNIALLKYLQEAGVPGELWELYLDHMRKLGEEEGRSDSRAG